MTDIPVAIIGAGPTGLATALVLGRHGIRSVVLEKHAGINPHPRAHVVNTRSMELLRAWGVADAVGRDAVGMAQMSAFRWRQRLAGPELGRIDLADGGGARLRHRLAASPEVIRSCAQDRVQQHLLDAVRAQGLGTVRFGCPALDVIDRGEHVDVALPDGTLRARFVVAADGATGGLRDRLGIDTDGVGVLGHQLNIYFHADLSRWTTAAPALLIWVLNTVSPGVFIGMDGVRRWTFNRAFDPATESVADYPPARCAQLVRDAVGCAELPVDVRSVGTWTMAARTATRYRRGRVFLAGDAAHQFPPTGGLGMNTGLADADNLGWKLAAVLAGWAPEELLDSYQAERRPVALANTRHSVRNARTMDAAGMGPSTAAIAARLESPDPAVAAEQRRRLTEAIAEQRVHFDALNQELGYVYGSDNPTDAEADYRPSTEPGARLPHVWLREGVSTLDLLGPGFTLLTGPAGAATPRLDAPVRTVRLPRAVADELGLDGALLVRPDGHVTTVPPPATG